MSALETYLITVLNCGLESKPCQMHCLDLKSNCGTYAQNGAARGRPKDPPHSAEVKCDDASVQDSDYCPEFETVIKYDCRPLLGTHNRFPTKFNFCTRIGLPNGALN